MQENDLTYTSLINLGIWSGHLPNLNVKDLINNLYNIKSTLPSVSKSNKGGYQTEGNLCFNPNFFSLVNTLNQLIINLTSNPNAKIFNMWGNISSFTNYNSIHTHGNNLKGFSGVVYLQIPKNSGGILFHNPININDQITYTLKEKEILIFPAILPHSVEPNLSQEDRISISFNYE
jgi:hypothetical protein